MQEQKITIKIEPKMISSRPTGPIIDPSNPDVITYCKTSIVFLSCLDIMTDSCILSIDIYQTSKVAVDKFLKGGTLKFNSDKPDQTWEIKIVNNFLHIDRSGFHQEIGPLNDDHKKELVKLCDF